MIRSSRLTRLRRKLKGAGFPQRDVELGKLGALRCPRIDRLKRDAAIDTTQKANRTVA